MPEITDAITDAELDEWEASAESDIANEYTLWLREGERIKRLIAAYRESRAEVRRALKSVGIYEED